MALNKQIGGEFPSFKKNKPLLEISMCSKRSHWRK